MPAFCALAHFVLGVATMRYPAKRTMLLPKTISPFRGADSVFNEDTIRWYLKAIGPLPQLNMSSEIRLSNAVRRLSLWEATRARLFEDLKRPPSTEEWAAAVETNCALVDLEFLSEVVNAHRSSTTHIELGDANTPDVIYDDLCRNFLRQLELMKQAREVMITHNLKLVIAVAKGYVNRGVNFQDLIQVRRGHGGGSHFWSLQN